MEPNFWLKQMRTRDLIVSQSQVILMLGDSERKLRAKFQPEEDARLRALVLQWGTEDWNLIAARMPGRTHRQCRERWRNYLDPNLNAAAWTRDEDELLEQKHASLGSSWLAISQFFPGRTESTMKTRYHQLDRARHDGFIRSFQFDASGNCSERGDAGTITDSPFNLFDAEFCDCAEFDDLPLDSLE